MQSRLVLTGVTEPRRMQSRSALTESQSHGECSPDRRSRSHRGTENAVQIGAHGVTEARRMQSRLALTGVTEPRGMPSRLAFTEPQSHGECSPCGRHGGRTIPNTEVVLLAVRTRTLGQFGTLDVSCCWPLRYTEVLAAEPERFCCPTDNGQRKGGNDVAGQASSCLLRGGDGCGWYVWRSPVRRSGRPAEYPLAHSRGHERHVRVLGRYIRLHAGH